MKRPKAEDYNNPELYSSTTEAKDAYISDLQDYIDHLLHRMNMMRVIADQAATSIKEVINKSTQ